VSSSTTGSWALAHRQPSQPRVCGTLATNTNGLSSSLGVVGSGVLHQGPCPNHLVTQTHRKLRPRQGTEAVQFMQQPGNSRGLSGESKVWYIPPGWDKRQEVATESLKDYCTSPVFRASAGPATPMLKTHRGSSHHQE
jgi:hypothetical protein